ncbi:hypothetical protein SDC9_156577 [bioreactor metagenome]|uniref:Uncharacterized protein n=1 Tax=bioreactor metagenome TaxID=1076179 RepID=A0A645F4K2_9ZZZZ
MKNSLSILTFLSKIVFYGFILMHLTRSRLKFGLDLKLISSPIFGLEKMQSAFFEFSPKVADISFQKLD